MRVYKIQILNGYGLVYEGIVPAKSKEQVKRDYDFINCQTIVEYENFAKVEILYNEYDTAFIYELTLKDSNEKVYFKENEEYSSSIEKDVNLRAISFLRNDLPKQHREMDEELQFLYQG